MQYLDDLLLNNSITEEAKVLNETLNKEEVEMMISNDIRTQLVEEIKKKF